jgi:hypothetical protein
LQTHVATERAIALAHHKRGTSHALNATCDKGIARSSLNSLCRAIDCLQARTTETVDGLPRDLYRQPRQQQSHTRHVAVILASLIGTTKNYILYSSGIDIRAAHRFTNDEGRHIIGSHILETTSIASNWSTHSRENNRVFHESIPSYLP